MPISPARSVAFDILLSVEQQDSYASELLHSDLLENLSQPDRGLATEIVMGVLRWQSKLDSLVAPHLSTKPARLDAEVRIALRMAAYQIRYLERIPARAAVNESVELVKRARKRSAAPLVNAVLRKVAELPNSGEVATQAAGARELARFYAHPEWLVDRWVYEYGPAATQRICAYDQQPPQTAIRFTGGSEAHSAVEAELTSEGVQLSPGEVVTSARRVVSGDITRTAAFKERRIAIQDEASQLVALLVGRGIKMLDCCAAPGSKTALLAERNPQAQIIAAEIHPHRARLLRERVPAANVEVITANVNELTVGADFDRVLADVPCSGTGTLARNPEIKWKLRTEDIEDLRSRQTEILKSAIKHLAPGGRVVYSTCSLEPEECQGVVEAVLRDDKSVRLVPALAVLQELATAGEVAWKDLQAITRGPYLRTLQGMQPCEGFFAAIIEKTE